PRATELIRIRPAVQMLLMAGAMSEEQRPSGWITVGGKPMPPAGVSRQAAEAHWMLPVTAQLKGGSPSLLVITRVAFLAPQEVGVNFTWNGTHESGLTVSGLPGVGGGSTTVKSAVGGTKETPVMCRSQLPVLQ